MTPVSCEILQVLSGKTLATAESCTGGGIGAALTSIAGISQVYKGGVIAYTNEIKEKILGVDRGVLDSFGAVSEQTAIAMAQGARKVLNADIAVSVTGLAGPDGDNRGNPVGTVYIGYADTKVVFAKHFVFAGDREEVRRQAVNAAFALVFEQNK